MYFRWSAPCKMKNPPCWKRDEVDVTHMGTYTGPRLGGEERPTRNEMRREGYSLRAITFMASAAYYNMKPVLFLVAVPRTDMVRRVVAVPDPLTP